MLRAIGSIYPRRISPPLFSSAKLWQAVPGARVGQQSHLFEAYDGRGFQNPLTTGSLRWFGSHRSPSKAVSTENMVEGKEPPPKHFMSQENRVSTPKSEIALQEIQWESEAAGNLPHPIWSDHLVRSVKQTHHRPSRVSDTLAFASVKLMRFGFDTLSGYNLGFVDEKHWLNRIIFLETVAGIPGLVAAMVRHLKSLRRMERDYGWIHTLLEEAENERMHLMSALSLKAPSSFFRLGVLLTQGIFLPFFTMAYIASPKYAHRFVGYLEEEAVKTYTHLIKTLEEGKLPQFQNLKAPLVARQYWELGPDASFKEMVYAIRADESHHRDVNHTFASMKPNEMNPFPPGH